MTDERLDRKLHRALADARDAAGDILRLKPDFSMAAYARTHPYENPNSLAPVLGALHTFGNLPERNFPRSDFLHGLGQLQTFR